MWKTNTSSPQPREECTREVDEGLDVMAKDWSLLKKVLKPILKEIKEERAEGKKQVVYLDGIERIVNTLKMNWDTKEKKSIPAGTSTVNNKPKLLTTQQKFQCGLRT